MDPVETNPNNYVVIFENDRVRVLEYTDSPGHVTTPHSHPDSVMYTLSSFQRRLVSGGKQQDVQIEAGRSMWLSAQEHHGENIGTTDTHVIFVELKEPTAGVGETGAAALGPSD